VFTVIIPTYNRADLLPRAIRSVLGQTLEDFELIVVDDGSTDDTRVVVEQFNDPRIHYVYQDNRGVSAARNAGANEAHGRYLTFLDSDDEALPKWLERFAEMLQETDTWVACCGIYRIDSQREEVATLPAESGPAFDHQQCLFLAGSFALETELFGALGGYVEDLGYAENTELALRLVPYCVHRGADIASIQEPLCRYHKRPFIKLGEDSEFRAILEATSRVLHSHCDRLAKDPRIYATYCHIAGVNAARLGAHRLARSWFVKGIRVYPWRLRMYGQLLMTLLPSLGRKVALRHWS
jgi:glycosyltransferase involved in cell wall biosynthesis